MGSRPVPEPEFVALVCETRRDRGRRSRESFRSVRGGLGGLDGGNALLAVIVQLLLENDPEAGTEGRYQDHSTVERIAVVRPDILRAAPGLREACRILFGDEQVEAKIEEYFGSAVAPAWRQAASGLI